MTDPLARARDILADTLARITVHPVKLPGNDFYSVIAEDMAAPLVEALAAADLLPDRLDRANKAALVDRAERAENALANADTVWRKRHEHLAKHYTLQATKLALHQQRADLQESRAVKAERALVRFGRKLDSDQANLPPSPDGVR